MVLRVATLASTAKAIAKSIIRIADCGITVGGRGIGGGFAFCATLRQKLG